MLSSHWGRAVKSRKKKKSCVYACRVLSVLSSSLQLCRLWPARLLCQEGSPGKNTGVYWPILVAIPFSSTLFPAALAANSPEYLVRPETLQPKQLHHPHTWSSQGQTPHLKTTGIVWLRKKTPKPPTSCTSCRLNPHNQLGRHCVYGIYKRSLRTAAKENALFLIAVDFRGKNTQE